MDVLAFIWRSFRRERGRWRRIGVVALAVTLLLLAGVVTIRVLAARNVPEVDPLLGTLDVVTLLLGGTFLAQLLLAAVNFEILRIEAMNDERER